MEVVVATRYVLTKDDEVGNWCGVAYKKDGRTKTELLWGTNHNVSVPIIHDHQSDYLFTVHHVFVERYINEILKLPFHDVEIFRFYLSRGDLPDRPTDLLGEVVRQFKDRDNKNCWTSYEHISGPYLANTQFVTSCFSAGCLDRISPEITKNLIPGRLAYMKNPQDLPILGVIPIGNEFTNDPKYYEDLLIRLKGEKPKWIN